MVMNKYSKKRHLKNITSNIVDQKIGRLAKVSPFLLPSWLLTFHRVAKVYLNCDKCNSEGSITSVDDATKNQYVIKF